ncbi:MAG: DUF2620 domain-containing protein [Caldibacillus debilis]|uniref:DUF2620 domain-containing protein n=3 Tax=Caldibacillus debilis TaxID=301148 RepID=A0A420VFT4_9BACI|nr:DUF2620 domain-containing protein [Caldibacillus debilis]MBY6273934.1 DUF2620 domain-containing protein [Bacillaceae bacterium]REJ18622.1 MAG: DUF2620 domain-containing protein [Caldibacillus debilis]REJ24751.1 MAG: DUF2620 domain-containing protein [Caldibacillus debilis]REJ26224.1 MAG: DUF2620 domain-containing protein [Caldibacillus debilis]RKO62552.1 Protein of unknown function DUF2620 [Caldibacillus debilis GB1]
MKIVIGGQVEKKAIEEKIKEIDPSIETVIKSDLEAAMAMKTGQADYYFGACHTGGGGALAMAIALIGRDKCETVSMPGKKPNEEKVIEAVKNGKKAFGFTADHLDLAVPMLIKAIKSAN